MAEFKKSGATAHVLVEKDAVIEFPGGSRLIFRPRYTVADTTRLADAADDLLSAILDSVDANGMIAATALEGVGMKLRELVEIYQIQPTQEDGTGVIVG